MSEKKVGKRLLTWVLVLVMTLSLLPLNVLAEEATTSNDVVMGYYDNGIWKQGTLTPGMPDGVKSVSKTATKTDDNVARQFFCETRTRFLRKNKPFLRSKS